MRQKTLTYLLIFTLTSLTACSLFKKIPVREDEIRDETTLIGWDDSNYNYSNEFSGQTAVNTTGNSTTDSKFLDQYSKLLGFDLEGSENKELVIESASWIGTKYKYGAAQKQIGTDCSGFVKSVFKTVYNISLSRTASGMAMGSIKVEKSDLNEGDLVFFKIGSADVSHVGIYLRDDYFIHASTSQGVIVSNLSESYYSKHFFCGGKIKQ